MTREVRIVAPARDRAAVGRSIVGMLTGLAVGTAVLINRQGIEPGGPGPEPISGSTTNELVVPAAPNGQCYVALTIDGTRLQAGLLDTGSDGSLVLGRNEARAAGIDVSALRFDMGYEAVSGHGRYAVARVHRVRIGDAFELRDVPVMVTERDQTQPLIGIGILQKLNLRLRGNGCEFARWPT